MGNKWEVTKWVSITNDEDHEFRDCYHYINCYLGNSFFHAITAVFKAKRESKCVKIIWRG